MTVFQFRLESYQLMKELDVEFVKNCDFCGNHTFTQIRFEKDIYIYRRTRKDGTIHSYEVFSRKIVKAGTTYPNGKVEPEDRVSYPGKSSFGRTAASCKTLEWAEKRFDDMLNGRFIRPDEPEEEILDTDSTDVVEIDSSEPKKRGRKKQELYLPIPNKGEKFSMKTLIEQTGKAQGSIYPKLKLLVDSGKVSVSHTFRNEGQRGKSQIMYVSNTDEFVQTSNVQQ